MFAPRKEKGNPWPRLDGRGERRESLALSVLEEHRRRGSTKKIRPLCGKNRERDLVV